MRESISDPLSIQHFGNKPNLKMKIYISSFLVLIMSFGAQAQLDSTRFFKTDKGCIVYDLYYGSGVEYQWTGECKDGFASGKGVCRFLIENKEVASLEGDFLRGVATGVCTVKTSSEETLICTYVNGRMIGIGSYRNTDGDHYKGQMRDLKMHGSGEMIYSNGSKFVGKFNKFSFWTGYFISLKEDTTFFVESEVADALPKPSTYNPVLNQELTEYFDDSWKRCEKRDAKFYRKITYSGPGIPKGLVKDFYISGTLLRKYHLAEVDFSDEDMNYMDAGPIEIYYENGKLYIEASVNYLGKFMGPSKVYHNNGELKTFCNYDLNGKLDDHLVGFNEKGDIINYTLYSSGEIVGNKYFNIDENGFWTRIYEEDFDENLETWKGSAKNTELDLIKGNLFMDLTNEGFYFFTKAAELDADMQFGVFGEFTAFKKKFKKDDAIGLVFDYKNTQNYSVFLVEGRGRAKVIQFKDGVEKLLADEKVDLENDDYPELNNISFEIYFFFEGIRFNVNDQTVLKVMDWDYQGTEIGVMAFGKRVYIANGLTTIEYYSAEQSEEFTNFVRGKVLSDNPSEYDGNGTGFFISNQGHIVTNYHVVEDAEKIDVKCTVNGKEEVFPAKLIVHDKFNDLAILRIDSDKFQLSNEIPFTLDYNTKDVGSEVFTLGYPMVDIMGSEIKFTDGKISSKTGLEGDIRTYQITAPIQPGNSGGPLFDTDGNVVGIICATLDREEFNSENVNFALKSNLLKNLIEASPEKIIIPKSKTSDGGKIADKISIYKDFVPVILIK